MISLYMHSVAIAAVPDERDTKSVQANCPSLLDIENVNVWEGIVGLDELRNILNDGNLNGRSISIVDLEKAKAIVLKAKRDFADKDITRFTWEVIANDQGVCGFTFKRSISREKTDKDEFQIYFSDMVQNPSETIAD